MKTETTTITAKNVKVQAAKTAKKIMSVAAVIPLVDSKKKSVFLKVVKGNAEKSIEATKNAVKNKKLDSFEGAAKAFVKEHGFDNLTVWTSRIAKVQPSRVAKSAAKQINSWRIMGMTVVNAADFQVEEKTAEPVAEEQKPEAKAAEEFITIPDGVVYQ